MRHQDMTERDRAMRQRDSQILYSRHALMINWANGSLMSICCVLYSPGLEDHNRDLYQLLTYFTYIWIKRWFNCCHRLAIVCTSDIIWLLIQSLSEVSCSGIRGPINLFLIHQSRDANRSDMSSTAASQPRHADVITSQKACGCGPRRAMMPHFLWPGQNGCEL